jgi:tetratricopeptide (TPR) repeat protein
MNNRSSLGSLPSGDTDDATATVTVVEEGTATTTIVASTAAESPVVPFAAAEVQSYVGDVTDADLPIREPPQASESLPTGLASVVQLVPSGQAEAATDTPAIRSVADDLAAATGDAYAIRTAASGVVLAGATHRGTLYAVYDLLERLGVRFFAPNYDFYDGHAEALPERETLVVEPIDALEEPSLEYRRKFVEAGWSHAAGTLPKLADWMAKTRHNVLACPSDYSLFGEGVTEWEQWREDLLPELERRGILVEVGGHGFDTFLPPEEYADAHPEWFDEEANVFDLTQDDAVETYTDNVVSYLEDHPEIDIFDAWPPDGASWPPAVEDHFGSVANGYGHVVTQLQTAIDEAFPDRGLTVETIAYASHNGVPDPEYAPPEDVLVDVAPHQRSFATPLAIDGDETNDSYSDLLEGWREAFDGELAIYEYFRQYSWHSLPILLPGLFASELPYYDAAGTTGIGTYAEPGDWITYELTHLLLGELAWDTDLQVDPFVDDYLEERYGAAAATMRRYVDVVEEAARALFYENRGAYEDEDAVTDAHRCFERAHETLQQAREIVEDGTAAAFLIDRLERNAAYAVADTEISYHEVRGQPEQANAARDRAKQLIRDNRFDGAIMDSRWAIRRYEEDPESVWPGLSELERENLELYRERWG